MQKMIASIRTHYRNLSAGAGTLYQRALNYTGLKDTTETRITAAVTVSVVIYYACALLQLIINLITAAAAPMLTALLTQ